MRRYSSFSALIAAFFSKDLYRDVAHSWGGIGFLHLMLLAFLASAPIMATIHVQLNSFADRDFPDLVKNFPDVKLTKGEVSSTIPQPYVVMDDAKSHKTMFVLDTTGKINNLEQTDAQILVTKTKIHMRERSNQQKIQDLKDFPDMEVTATKMRSWMKILATWCAPVGTPFLMFGYVLVGLISMMLLALFGALIAGSNSTVSAGGYMRLASVARTPAFLLGTAFQLLNITIPMWFLGSIAVSVAYMAFAVTCANETPAKPFDGYAPPPPQPFGQTTEPARTQEPSCFTPPPQEPPQ